MGQAQPKRRTALIVEDDAELRSLTAALLEEEQLDTIECESAEAALAVRVIAQCSLRFVSWERGARNFMNWELQLSRPVRTRHSGLPEIIRTLGDAVKPQN
jgi:DNA-binding NtrC family response regulator